MKHKTAILTLTAALALGLAGCGQNDSTTADDANKAAVAAAEAAKAQAAKAAEAAKAEAAKVAEAAKAAKAAEAATAEAAKVAEAARAEAAKTAETARAEAAKAAEAARSAAAATAEAAKVEAAKAADTAATQGLIVKATSLVAEGKYSEASAVVVQLAGKSLTSDQSKIVDSLKEQIQKGLAAKAVNDAASGIR